MPRFLPSLLALACLPLAIACGDEPLPMFMVLNYQVRCANTGGCTGIPPRMIQTLNGENGNNISCSVQETGGRYLFNMTFDHPSGDPEDDYGLTFQNVLVNTAGGPAQGGEVDITEQGNFYTGRVGGSPPPDTCGDDPPGACEVPCRLYEIEFTQTDNGPGILGKLQCVGLPLGADSMVTREVAAPAAPADPATFLVENCDGLI